MISSSFIFFSSITLWRCNVAACSSAFTRACNYLFYVYKLETHVKELIPADLGAEISTHKKRQDFFSIDFCIVFSAVTQKMLCCIIWPAFGCCTLQTLVEVCAFTFFTLFPEISMQNFALPHYAAKRGKWGKIQTFLENTTGKFNGGFLGKTSLAKNFQNVF